MISWTSEEDLALQVAVQKYGTNWSKVIMILPEKSTNECKLRWKEMNKIWRNDTTEYKERKLLGQQKLVGKKEMNNRFGNDE